MSLLKSNKIMTTEGSCVRACISPDTSIQAIAQSAPRYRTEYRAQCLFQIRSYNMPLFLESLGLSLCTGSQSARSPVCLHPVRERRTERTYTSVQQVVGKAFPEMSFTLKDTESLRWSSILAYHATHKTAESNFSVSSCSSY